jgi:hypothetical protein
MPKPRSLADVLQAEDPRSAEQQAVDAAAPSEPTLDGLVDVSDTKEFCKRVLESREFRQYILQGIVMHMIPPAILTRVMDHGWGKPPEKHEHTGANGEPIKTITEVRRVIVRPRSAEDIIDELERSASTEVDDKSKLTH